MLATPAARSACMANPGLLAGALLERLRQYAPASSVEQVT